MDATTYTLLTEQEATDAAKNLSKKIYNWTHRFRKSLLNDTIHYIRHQLEKTEKDPFGYFYLLIKLQKSPMLTIGVATDARGRYLAIRRRRW
jgi:hypothetical protein